MQKKLVKSSTNKTLTGVLGGLGKYLGFDPTIVRVAYVLLTFFTCFSGIIVYIILCLVIPKDNNC